MGLLLCWFILILVGLVWFMWFGIVDFGCAHMLSFGWGVWNWCCVVLWIVVNWFVVLSFCGFSGLG